MKKKTIVLIQARMGSSRFPGKVLTDLLDAPILAWVINASKRISLIDEVIVATTDLDIDLPIVQWCQKNKISYFQGSEQDVLKRYFDAASFFGADYVVRVTADCPLLNPELASEVVYCVTHGGYDYASNIMPPTWPDGLDCEAFTFEALKIAHQHAKRPSDREHVTPYIRNNQHKFKTHNVCASLPHLQKHRWTIDTVDDLKYVEEILTKANNNYSIYNILNTISQNPDMRQPCYKRNEGFTKSIESESVKCQQFEKSQELLTKALDVIPLGSQTFSKSYIQYPENTAPLFLTHGYESHVWDADGNEYIDLVNGLLPNILGYNDPDVNFAISSQMQKGISFSLATELEIELAELLCNIIPCAQKVRFGKNGTDATSAAVRLARAYTGKDKIIVCGYHGWQDWYIGTTSRNKGIPKAVCELSTSVPYNDLEIIETLLKTQEYAGIILEPCNTQEPKPGYLEGIKHACDRFGAVLIFDEIITGFRFSLGGAQSYFKVTPHLACFGKAMGNGMPISAIVGDSRIMKEMENIFFSGTFGGETLSLAAAIATIKKLKSNNVIDYLWNYGTSLANEVISQRDKYELQGVLNLCGYAPWKLLQFMDHPNASSFEIKTFFIQEMIKRGIIVVGSHNISYAHNELDKYKIINAYEECLQELSHALRTSTLASRLESPAIKPLFKVR